jgi:F-type H+-transporting ATPase subunit b
MENLMNFDTGLMFWTWLTFLIVLVVLGAKAWKPMIEALEKREEFIRESLEEAKAARHEAEKVAAEYDEMIAKARHEVQEIVATGKVTAERIKEDILKDASAKAGSLLKQAETQISLEKEKAIAEIKTQIVELSIFAAEKIIGKSLNQDDNKKLVNDALQQFGKS